MSAKKWPGDTDPDESQTGGSRMTVAHCISDAGSDRTCFASRIGRRLVRAAAFSQDDFLVLRIWLMLA